MNAQKWIEAFTFVPLALLLSIVSPASALPQGAVSESDAPRSMKTIIDLQPFRETSSGRIKDAQGGEGMATLINLNPGVNGWYLLRLDWGKGSAGETYHLENTAPRARKLLLGPDYPAGLILAEGENRSLCDLWGAAVPDRLKEARASGAAYAPLCNGKLYLRNPVRGYRTAIESTAEFLRDNIPGGEKIETFIRDRFLAEGYREKVKIEGPQAPAENRQQVRPVNGPASARLDPQRTDRIIVSSHLGIDIEGSAAPGMVSGSWYVAKESPGVYVSLITAETIAPEILHSYRKQVNSLEPEEMDALVYLVAFDLERFEIRFARGTEHPRVNWSDRVVERMRERALPGPDGIGQVAPLVSTGMISPADAVRTAAAFTGGFKRAHGAFAWGKLAMKNSGSHYGFLENGVVFSTLQPGLATIYSLADGRLEMKTWPSADQPLLTRIISARQNGVPIIADFDPAADISVPGSLVSRWGEGNWSGSVDRRLRTLRAGAALQEIDNKRFLLYAVFTSATPSAMARVFQAYRCRYGMLLDMNALELTYLAIYKRKGPNLYVQHLIQGMSQVDKSEAGKYVPRFLGYPDNRDFFYLLRKGAP